MNALDGNNSKAWLILRNPAKLIASQDNNNLRESITVQLTSCFLFGFSCFAYDELKQLDLFCQI